MKISFYIIAVALSLVETSCGSAKLGQCQCKTKEHEVASHFSQGHKPARIFIRKAVINTSRLNFPGALTFTFSPAVLIPVNLFIFKHTVHQKRVKFNFCIFVMHIQMKINILILQRETIKTLG